jgi:amino-acid N-acetyltransferase
MTTTGKMGMSGVRLRMAQPGDWLAVESLLADAELPLAGAREHLRDFIVAEGAAATLLGCAALERYAAVAAGVEEGAARVSGLLRSLAVAPAARGLGLGASLVESLLSAARAQGLADVTLLTTTAAEYFPRFGFQRIAREAAPLAVRDSIEFREACPDSAVVMSRAL